ncbi:protein phosphatase 2C domain-containing protein [Flammeovirga sp. SJP92]|uniref:protein phosphatase 2C domain-containing protein n=1 Tax=Flammeovirga sp. SJP92 TaxID=1775430 RepID=UPI0007882C3A|nr:protein phosphatase 2C domain-containing protein [Flammeovirga sp. SJP92]KXX69791.1 stage II sporulation protein E (SpoIIE) [Flammeovirga sp. SJP92]
MRIYKTLNIGEFHTNHCEDFLIEEQIGSNEKLIAVLDGCTMGTESVFASILFGKILRNIAKKKFYEAFLAERSLQLQDQLKDVVKLLIEEVKLLKNQLGLETNELLSTLIIGIIETNTSKAELLTVGDGLICKDGKLIEYAQDDKPDYLGYHLADDFETWFESQKQKLSITSFKDLSISTDGIFTFQNLDERSKQKPEKEIIAYLLMDNEGVEFPNFLERKVRFLKDKWNHTVTDDLAIIRVKNDRL